MTDTIVDTVAERVARGVALLDEKVPGWHDRIDLSRLDMWDEARCILGQLFDDFFDGAAELELQEEDTYTSGFDRRPELTDPVNYTHLHAEWIRVITDRRSTVEVQP